jgi:hypothetical protein
VEFDIGTNGSNTVWKQPLAVSRQLSASTSIIPDSVEHTVQFMHVSLGSAANATGSATTQIESTIATMTQSWLTQV